MNARLKLLEERNERLFMTLGKLEAIEEANPETLLSISAVKDLLLYIAEGEKE